MLNKLLTWYTSRAALPFWFVFAADCLIVFLSGLMAYAVNYSASETLTSLGTLSVTMGVYLLCYIVGFRMLHTYSGIIRKTSVTDLARVWLALLIGVALIMLLRMFAATDTWLLPFRLRDLLMQVLIASILMTGLRATAKIFYDLYLRHLVPGSVYGYSDKDLISMEMAHLLNRDPISVNLDGIKRVLRGKRILVTGAAGSIGSELSMLLADSEPEELILIDQAESPLHSVRIELARLHPEVKCATIVTSICHSRRMERIFSEYRPEYVFHAAAYKHVPMMEDNPVESVLNNVDGTRKLADIAVRYGVAKFVMISTDKAVNPTNVMGCSKRICEIYVQALDKAIKEGKVKGSTAFVTTRFGNVLGSNGSVIPLFEQQIKSGGPVTVTHPDIIRYFMLIPEACKLVLEAGTMGNGGEIFVFDMGKPVRIADLARRMIQMSGAKGVEIKFTGLRDGEKLYEEVLNDKEITLPTFHAKIKIAKVREYDYSEVNATISEMVTMSSNADDMTIVASMKALVPEFKSQHSKYEALDK